MRLGLLLIIPALLWAGCSHRTPNTPTREVTLRADVAAVRADASPRVHEFQGTIHAADDAVLSSRAMGPVVRDYVKVGDRVTKGQPLVEIEERMSMGQLAQAHGALAQSRAALTLAERNYHRYRALHEKQACSQLELDLALMQYEQAKGAVEQAQGAVATAGSISDESIVKAPFDALVAEKMVSIGDLVAPGRPLIRVQSSEDREVWLTVRAAEVRHFRRGDTLQVAIHSQPAESGLSAVVTEIAPSGDPSTQTFLVKAATHGLAVPAGVGVTAYVNGEPDSTVVIPRHAVYSVGGLELVSVVDSSGVTRTRSVALGRARGDQVEVLSGLAAGQRIVIHRTGLIAEGTRIQGEMQ